MKRKIFPFLMVFCVFAIHAQIVKVDTMQEVFEAFQDADSKTLAVFDVDMVLVQPSDPAFQMANILRYSTVAKRFVKKIPTDKRMILFSLMTISCDPVLIDEMTPQFFNQIIERGIPAMALTANLTGSLGAIPKMEEWRVEGLRQLGIDFSVAAPCRSTLVFDDLAAFRGNYPTYVSGMLFANGKAVSKGEAFLAFLEKTGVFPDKVIFIDDREANLKSVESALQKLGKSIEFLGLHYLGAQDYPSEKISKEAFESRWELLIDLLQEFN